MKKIVLFLRKKIEGQNSMEELAHTLKENIQGLDIIELPFHSTSFLGMIKNGLFARKHQGEINHIFSITEGYLSLFLTKKRIITVHDLYFHQFSLLGRVASYILWIFVPSFITQAYTCISNKTYVQLIKLLPWLKKKTCVIYNPINPLYFTKPTKDNNSIPIILHIGTAKHKNLDKVIKALKDIDCKLVIVGKLFESQIDLLKRNNINYTNCYDISTYELCSLYQKADIITFPSQQEGFGMIVAESNASGIPIIAGDIPVLREIGQDAAYYVNPYSIDDIRNAVLNILHDSALKDRLIAEGHKNAQRFNIKNIARHYLSLYNRISTEQ